MKAYCLFEQSGTFKNEFKKLGIDAYDYDIRNDFGQTDFVVDIFTEIQKAYEGWESIFDNMGGGQISSWHFSLAHDLKRRFHFRFGESYPSKRTGTT